MTLNNVLRTYNRENQTNFEFSNLFSYEEIEKNKKVIPCQPAVYAWYFKKIKNLPKNFHYPIENGEIICQEKNGIVLNLYYIGISGNNNYLRKRLNQHFNGNAESSTLRYSLGCLLSEHLDIKLQIKAKSSKRFSKNHCIKLGENVLSKWLSENAFISFFSCDDKTTAEKIEKWLISKVSLPLNIEHNSKHPFCRELKKIRKTHRDKFFNFGE
jgi:predicted GIY-YIG superfamily endonuclease